MNSNSFMQRLQKPWVNIKIWKEGIDTMARVSCKLSGLIYDKHKVLVPQWQNYIDGLVQHCSNSSALAMELLQSCTKPSIFVSCDRWFTKDRARKKSSYVSSSHQNIYEYMESLQCPLRKSSYKNKYLQKI